MSALQCPARVFLARPGRAESSAAAVRAERIARVWCGSRPAVLASAETVAALLGVGVEVREDLRVLRVAGRLPAVLEEIADLHPGEAVLVVTDDLTLPDDDDDDADADADGCVELEVDADGWRLVSRGRAADRPS